MTSARMPDVLGFLLFSGIALLPLYIFPSGGMQPAHFLLILFSLIHLGDVVAQDHLPRHGRGLDELRPCADDGEKFHGVLLDLVVSE